MNKSLSKNNKKTRKMRKGAFGMDLLSEGAIGFMVFVVVISFAALFLSQMSTQVNSITGNNTSTASTIVTQGISGIAVFGNWTTLIAFVIVFVILLAIIMKYIAGRGGSAGLGG